MGERDSEPNLAGGPRVDLAVDVEFGDAATWKPEITTRFSVS